MDRLWYTGGYPTITTERRSPMQFGDAIALWYGIEDVAIMSGFTLSLHKGIPMTLHFETKCDGKRSGIVLIVMSELLFVGYILYGTYKEMNNFMHFLHTIPCVPDSSTPEQWRLITDTFITVYL